MIDFPYPSENNSLLQTMLSHSYQSALPITLFIGLIAALPNFHQPPNRRIGETSWTRHDPIGLGPRQEHGVAGLEDRLYVIGGVRYGDKNNTVEMVNSVEYLSLDKQTWHVAAPVPQAVNHANIAAVDEKIYIIGSLAGGFNWTALPSTYVYTSFNDSWRQLAPMPEGAARGSSAVGVYNDTIYLAGGQLFLEIVPPYRQPGISTVSSYNVKANSWDTTLPSLPQARQHVGGAVAGSTFYVIGGREFDIHSYHNTTYALDLENPVEWKEMAQMPTARGSIACAASGTVIYCFGGEGDTSNENGIFAEVEAYDTVSDSWSVLPPMEVPRHGTGAVVLEGQIWIPGGGLTMAMAPTGVVDSLVIM